MLVHAASVSMSVKANESGNYLEYRNYIHRNRHCTHIRAIYKHHLCTACHL